MMMTEAGAIVLEPDQLWATLRGGVMGRGANRRFQA